MADSKKVLITGTAGFIGFHLTSRFIREGYEVVGIDAVNSYYDVNLKLDRLRQHGIQISEIKSKNVINSTSFESYRFYHLDLEDWSAVESVFNDEKPYAVVNLAAQAGVRYSLTHPREYITANIDGFLNILEGCRHYDVKHLIYASSSSVYGLNTQLPFSVDDSVDHPISLYATTKKSNELMAHTYSYLYNVPTTGLRFFTVYGPWGRPDMALFLFAKSIFADEPIQLFNGGDMTRDFTYIDDIVESIYRLVPKPPKASDSIANVKNPSTSTAPYQLFNIGNNNPIKLREFITEIELAIGRNAKIDLYPLQPGDVKATHADVKSLIEYIGYMPDTSIRIGVQNFIGWYKNYYKVK
jgi:UDP-glucuronate 4-epimerase